MKRLWSVDELGERWTLSPDDVAFVAGNADAGKLGLACQLAFWRSQGCFPEEEADLAPAVLAHLAGQIGVEADVESYAFTGRSGRRHRQLVLDHLAVGTFDHAAEAAFRSWLLSDMLPREPTPSALEDEITGWFAARRVVRPGSYRLDRLVRSLRAGHDDAMLAAVGDRLDDKSRLRLNALLADDGEGAAYTRLSADPGKPGLDSLLAEIAKLELFRGLELSAELLGGVHPDLVKRFRRRAAVENAWELRRHPDRIRLPLLVFYCVPREAEIIDGLVDLLIQITHRITVKAERRVVTELLEEAKAVRGKTGILFKVASAVTSAPDGSVREVIFPVVDERTFQELVKEALATGSAPSRRVHKAVRASYGAYYRRMMPKLLAALDFRSNNSAHKPLTDALAKIRAAENDGRQCFSTTEVAIEGVVRPKWRDIVIEEAPDGSERVNRINYEICVLQTLREKLRCKEVWVAGAGRFRNPDDDLPADFAKRRAECYERLGLTMDARAFTGVVKAEMEQALAVLNRGVPSNTKVKLNSRRRHPIVVTPLDPLPAPPTLEALGGELGRRWPMTGLLDILKETDLRIGFTQAFSTAASREVTDPDEAILRRFTRNNVQHPTYKAAKIKAFARALQCDPL